MAPPPVERRVELGTGLGYHVLEWGADAPALDHTVVLLHGFLDSAWGWEATVGAGLAGRYHLVAPDLRGHGDSDRVGAGGYYHFLDYLADLDDLLPRVARRRVSLIGHSMGGTIAGYFAGAFPERIERLALLEGLGPPEPPDGVAARVRIWSEAWRRARGRTPRRLADVGEAAERLRALDPRLDPALAARLAERGTSVTADGGRCFKHDPLHLTPGPLPFHVEVALDFWRRITCPVLLVEGAASDYRQASEEAARREAGLHAFTRVVLPDAGHMMQRHAPAALAAALDRFLSA